MDPSDSAATPEEHALEDAIGNFLESGNKAGNYRDALERVLTDWRQCLEARGTETVERVSKRDMATYANALSSDKAKTAATAWTYYDYVSAFLPTASSGTGSRTIQPRKGSHSTSCHRDRRKERRPAVLVD